MNAACALARSLPRSALRRLAPGVPDDARDAVVGESFALDLCGLLNRLRVDELRALAGAQRLATDARPELCLANAYCSARRLRRRFLTPPVPPRPSQ